MPVSNINSKETKPYVFHVNGEPLFGIMANVTAESEAGSLSPAELQQVLFSGMHTVEILPYVKKDRDFSDKRSALLTATVAPAAPAKTGTK
jgi:hypothetical protein